MDRIENRVKKNRLDPGMNKCTKLNFRGTDRSFNNMVQILNHSKSVKDLGLFVSDSLTWKMHIKKQLRIANKLLHLHRRNVAVKVQTLVKLELYKFLKLPVLLYGLPCVFASRADLHLLENFQKKVVNCARGIRQCVIYAN